MARDVVQKVKLSATERDQLRARAAQLGVADPRLLATIASNVNQLAKMANIAGQVDTSRRLEQTLAEVDGVMERLRELKLGI